MKKSTRAASAALAALLAAVSPAAAAGPLPDRIGGWTLAPDPSLPGAGCTMRLGDARGGLVFRLVGGDVGLDATSKDWFASGSLSYPVHLTIDNDPPTDIAAGGSEPDTLRLLPNPKLPTSGFVARLKTGTSLAVRKDGNPGIETVTFGVADFGAAYARLEACAAAARSRAGAATAERAGTCAKLADGAAAAVGGTREPSTEDDRIPIEMPGVNILVLCGSASEAPSIELWRDEPGMPVDFLATAGKLAGVLTSQPARAYAALPAACLKHVTGATFRHGGKRAHHPDGTTMFYSGEVKARHLKLACQYYDPRMMEPLITLERE